MSCRLNDFGVVCALGNNTNDVYSNLVSSKQNFLVVDHDLPFDMPQQVGRVTLPKTELSLTRNEQLAYLAFEQIKPSIDPLIKKFGAERIAVVIGTSTSSIYEGEIARKVLAETGSYPESFKYQIQEMSAPANYIAKLAGVTGPVYGISTACASSGKALGSAKALLEAGLVDAVIAGGVDSLTQLTVNGFKSLESISEGRCKPFSTSRDGINIGEAAALFVMTSQSHGIQLLGVGESSDAHHMSAPSPDGEGAAMAMSLALKHAGLSGEQIDYVNLHGTGTLKNDEMEAYAMHKVCGSKVFCSSTKHLTGHTLGAAGALEIGFCWLLLSAFNKSKQLPQNCPESELNTEFSNINLYHHNNIENIQYCMSNSFAFGGTNFSAVIGNLNE